MLPQELEKMPKEFEKIMQQLEDRVMADIVRRIKINSEITRSADWQIYRLERLGKSKEEIKEYIQEALELSDKQIDKLYEKAFEEEYVRNKELYELKGVDFIPFNENAELQQLIGAMITQTKEAMYNISQSAGFVKIKNGQRIFTPLTQYYQDTLDNAIMDITTGVFDYNTVLKRTVNELTNSGLRTIDFASGRSYRVDSAVRTAVMTGISQVTGHISEKNAKDLGTEYFEVTAHGTARPSHQVWQGKVFTMQQLKDVCGYGTVTGLKGANCYHDFYPFFPGISERIYTDEELKEWTERENTPKEYNGKEYTTYEASQKQRKLELLMRKQRQDIKLLQEGGANEEDIIAAKAKYRTTMNEYVDFSNKMMLPQQMDRVYGDALKSKIGDPQAYKLIEKRANLYYNKSVNAYLKDEIIRKNIRNNPEYETIHWGRQDKHIKGTNNYIENKSYFTISKDEIEEIVSKNKGTGYIYRNPKDNKFNNKEKVILNKNIGHYINVDEHGDIIEEYDTNTIIIHYSKTVIHIRPARKE